MTPIVLTVAGSDPSGGAGLQADLKTFHRHGVYGAAIPTVVTVQNTRGVTRVDALSSELVKAQLDSVFGDLAPNSVKTGALGSPEIVREVAACAARTSVPWVVDPVLAPSLGGPLSREDLAASLRVGLVPEAALVTPNAQEAAALAEMPVRTLQEAAEAAARIASLGAAAVLVTGGHLEDAARGADILWHRGTVREYRAGSVVEGEFHGTGCALSASIASRLAGGDPLEDAVAGAKAWLEDAMTQAFAVGGGARPVNHLFGMD